MKNRWSKIARRAWKATWAFWNVHRSWTFFGVPIIGLGFQAWYNGWAALKNGRQTISSVVFAYFILWTGNFLINLWSARDAQTLQDILSALADFLEQGNKLVDRVPNNGQTPLVDGWRSDYLNWRKATQNFLANSCSPQAAVRFETFLTKPRMSFRHVHLSLEAEYGTLDTQIENLTIILDRADTYIDLG